MSDYCPTPTCLTPYVGGVDADLAAGSGALADFASPCGGAALTPGQLNQLPNGGGPLVYSTGRRIVVPGNTGAHIQYAINLAASAGAGGAGHPIRTVFIPAGEYWLKKPVVIGALPNCALRIEGEFAQLRPAPGTKLTAGLWVAEEIPGLHISRLVIRDAFIGVAVDAVTGPVSVEQVRTVTCGTGFWVNNSRGVTLRGCTAISSLAHGLVTVGGTTVRMDGCASVTSLRSGFLVTPSTEAADSPKNPAGLSLGDVEFSHVSAEGNGGQGIACDLVPATMPWATEVSRTLVRSSRVTDNARSGLYLAGPNHMVHGVVARVSPATPAILLDPTTRGATIEGCHLESEPASPADGDDGKLYTWVPACARINDAEANFSMGKKDVAAAIESNAPELVPEPGSDSPVLVAMTAALTTLSTAGPKPSCG